MKVKYMTKMIKIGSESKYLLAEKWHIYPPRKTISNIICSVPTHPGKPGKLLINSPVTENMENEKCHMSWK